MRIPYTSNLTLSTTNTQLHIIPPQLRCVPKKGTLPQQVLTRGLAPKFFFHYAQLRRLWRMHRVRSAQIATARILIYSATRGFRHDSIPTATEALKQGGNSINVQFDATEDHSQFTTAILSQYDALLFLSTTGEGAPGLKRHQRDVP